MIIFTTGLGTPHGFPFVPVIKITANTKTHGNLSEYIDVFLDIDGPQKADNLDKMGSRLYEEVVHVANGSRTRSEIMKYGMFINNIYVLGPTL